MTVTTLVIGGRASEREQTIASAIIPGLATAVILEGLPDGNSTDPALTGSDIQMTRIAPGCACCTGNLTMRVTLNRLLRHRPARLYISLATASHLDDVRRFLTQPPYDTLLTLTENRQI